MSEQPKALELAHRLATRQVRNYCSATGDPPRVSGFSPDRECAEAATLLRTQHAELEALRKDVERLKRENHNLNWALGTDGYDQMATHKEQAEHKAGMAKVSAALERFKDRADRFSKIIPEGTDLLEWAEQKQAEVERLREDAARYRWLRSQHWEEASMCVLMQPKVAVKLGYDCPSLDRLDAAIDAERGGGADLIAP